jgi:hypothetical protein
LIFLSELKTKAVISASTKDFFLEREDFQSNFRNICHDRKTFPNCSYNENAIFFARFGISVGGGICAARIHRAAIFAFPLNGKSAAT